MKQYPCGWCVNVPMKASLFITLGFSMVVIGLITLQGCSAPRLVVAGETCSVEAWQADHFTLQDVLPGRESNLRKQRVYVVLGSPAKGFNVPSEWMLAVDSVLIPLRVRAEENGSWQWSGTRNFYQRVRDGVMSLEEEHPVRSESSLPETAFMIQRDENGCTAVELPLVLNLGVIAMP